MVFNKYYKLLNSIPAYQLMVFFDPSIQAEYFTSTYKDKAKYKLEALKEAQIKQRAITLRPKTKVKKLEKEGRVKSLSSDELVNLV